MIMATATLRPEWWSRSPEVRESKTSPANEDLGEVNVFKAIDDFLDLGHGSPSRLRRMSKLTANESQLFFRHLQELVRLGVVGKETYEVEGQPREAFAETAYADPALRDAPPFRRRLRTPLDLRG